MIPRDELKIGKDGASIQFFVNDVDEVCQSLKEKGVEFVVEPHDEPWGGRQARCHDPDGNTLEVTQIDWGKYFQAAAQGTS